jgi:acetolactate synthase I/II/III large subunit
MKVHGGLLAVAQLQQAGIDVLFALNGGHVGHIFDACLELGMPIIDTRHEDAAVHMAHAYARLRRRPGVACLTAGPGVANGVSAVATAHVNSAPIVVIGGKTPVPQFDMGALQDIDQIGVMRPVCKSASTVLEAARIPRYIAEALHRSMIPPYGPAFIEIPVDVLRAEVEAVDGRPPSVSWAAPSLPAPSPQQVEKAAASLSRAQRPVILAGSGVWWADATAAVRHLAESWQVPVLTTSLARGVLPGDHSLNLYAARSRLLSEADVVLVLGTRFNYIVNYGQPPRLPADATLIRVDSSAEELGRNRVADIPLHCDVGAFVAALEAAASPAPKVDKRWLEAAAESHRRLVDETRSEATSNAVPIHPLRLCADVVDTVPSQTHFVADGGDILSHARLMVHPENPGRFLDPGPFGCLGAGLPFANATRLIAQPDPVVCITGDGALGLNLMELDTASRHRLPIVVVVSNNAAWGIERNSQIVDYGVDRVVATELSDCRFDRVAQALGCHGERVTDPDELKPAIMRALEAGKPALVDVVTDVGVRSPDLLRGLASVPDRSPLAAWATSDTRTGVEP